MANMIIGPIIGKVTKDSARILIESDVECDVSCTATTKDSHHRRDIHLVPGRPGVVEFQGLQPNTRHTLGFQGIDGAPDGSFQTFPEGGRHLDLLAASCNKGEDRGDADLFKVMHTRYVGAVPTPTHLLLHIGDQVYCDSAFDRGMELLHGGDPHDPATLRSIQNGYRSRYRQVWTQPHTRRVLANVSNLMIWDDHEIRDDWGSRPCDHDPESHEYVVGQMARLVYRRYQRQLWDDIPADDQPEDGCEDHHHVFGETGIMFVDQRGGRSFGYDPQLPYLGKSQWDRIEKNLAEDGLFGKARALIVVTSVPLAYLGPNLTNAMAHGKFDDLEDHWAWGKHGDEQVHILRRLRQWKDRGQGSREFLVVGGDVHLGGYTSLMHNGREVFGQQLITSPVCNSGKWRWLLFAGIRGLLEQDECLKGNYRFEHRDFQWRENFARIRVRMSQDGSRPTVSGDLVTA